MLGFNSTCPKKIFEEKHFSEKIFLGQFSFGLGLWARSF